MTTLHPIILSGGSGTRLWPLSRADYPKQLLSLTGEQSLLQQTIARAMALPGAQAPLLVCNQAHRFLIREQCLAAGHAPGAIYLEPVGRNTAPAIVLAALHLAASDPEAIMLVLPADHIIEGEAEFAGAVAIAARAASQGYLATFGIAPTAAETGYGYIRSGSPLAQVEGAFAVSRFVEKPDRAIAEQYVAKGGHTWNSGMFMFTARRYLEELQTYRPDILKAVQRAFDGRAVDLDFCRPLEAAFTECASESIDYAVMQSTAHAAVVPARFRWSDVGSWHSLWAASKQDVTGNAVSGDAFVADTRNSYVRAESRQVTVIGLQDVVVVETADAVLVIHKDKAQDVKLATGHLAKSGRREHLEHRRVYRPWGWYEGIDSGERFQVKRLMVKPGEQLSLQLHHHRAEHWVVVRGTASVTVGDRGTILTENESTYIPLGQTHRLANPGKIPLHIIEVQSGTYLGEDDIVRFQDVYGRNEKPQSVETK